MLAGLRASLGDSEKAIQDLEGAYDDRDSMMVFLERDPLMDTDFDRIRAYVH